MAWVTALAQAGCIDLRDSPPLRPLPDGLPADGVASDGPAHDSRPDGPPPGDGGPDAMPDAAPDAMLDAGPAVDACVPGEEVCNRRDDDCDGTVDEGFQCICCGEEDTAPPCNGCPAGTLRPPDGWVCIPAGPFTMGDGELVAESGANVHGVELTRPFWITTTEVTRRDWIDLVLHVDPDAATPDPSYHRGVDAPWTCRGDDIVLCPVESVSWLDAVWYSVALSTRAGLGSCYDTRALDACAGNPHGGCQGAPEVEGGVATRDPICFLEQTLEPFECPDASVVAWSTMALDCPGYRLPTEAEWERAHRAGSDTVYQDIRHPEGDGEWVLDAVAWYAINSNGEPQQVAITKALDGPRPAFPPTPEPPTTHRWGLHDTHGNVAEWTHDVWGRLPVANVTDPRGPEPEDARDPRVIRGGSWMSEDRQCRSGARTEDRPDRRRYDVGFRVVRPQVPRLPDGQGCPP